MNHFLLICFSQMTSKYIWYDSCPNRECKSINFKQCDNDTNYSYKYEMYFNTTKLIKCDDCGKVYGYIFVILPLVASIWYSK